MSSRSFVGARLVGMCVHAGGLAVGVGLGRGGGLGVYSVRGTCTPAPMGHQINSHTIQNPQAHRTFGHSELIVACI